MENREARGILSAERASSDDARDYRLLPWYQGGIAYALASAEALLESIYESGLPAMRWYRTTGRALVLGAGQDARLFDADACRLSGVTVYRRTAGGAAVYADEEMLCLDVVLPHQDPLLVSDLTESYHWLGEAWVAALTHHGIESRVVRIEEARASAREETREGRLARLICYGTLSPYEVLVGSRKVVGFAQVRRRHGALFQIGVLLGWSSSCLASLMALDEDERQTLAAALERRVGGLRSCVPHIGPAEVAQSFMGALQDRGFMPRASGWSDEERSRTKDLLAGRYTPILSS